MISGTKEWSVASVNCLVGCSHDCRYCYARANAIRFKRIQDPAEWARPRMRQAELNKRRRKLGGRVMFPTTHDVLPDFLPECTSILENLLSAGNEVLVVSKPHLACIEALVKRLARFRDQLLFRFTIGARRDDLLAYWEPGAPTFGERLQSLRHAFGLGFATSVSCEPLLDAEDAAGLFAELEPWVSDTIWMGKMNQARARCIPGTDAEAIARIERGQLSGKIRAIYARLGDHPKIRWKESFKAELGLPGAERPGLDV